jgi:hypothetical protein
VQVQTKVWYTHLGKGRTQLAVRGSLAELGESRAPITVGFAQLRNKSKQRYKTR